MSISSIFKVAALGMLVSMLPAVVKAQSVSVSGADFFAAPNPIPLESGMSVGKTTLAWSAPGHSLLKIFVQRQGDSSSRQLFAGSLPSSGTIETGNWVSDALEFLLVDQLNEITVASLVVHTTTMNVSFKADPDPIVLTNGSPVGKTQLCWNAPSHGLLKIFAGSVLFADGLANVGCIETGAWVSDASRFSLVDNLSGSTIATLIVNAYPPVTLISQPNPLQLSGGTALGQSIINWVADGHNLVDVRVGTTLFARGGGRGAAQTGPWVSKGLDFGLYDADRSKKIARTTIETLPSTQLKLFHDSFSIQGERLDELNWTTETGDPSFIARTKLQDWRSGGAGRFWVDAKGARMSLSTYSPVNPGGLLYGTHAKTKMSFKPEPGQTLIYSARMKLNSLQPGIVYAMYFYGCQGPCATQHDEIDIEILSNQLQPGLPMKFQVNFYKNEPLGPGHGSLVNLPAGFDPLAPHEWTIWWSLERIDIFVDGISIFSTYNFVPQAPMQLNVIAWAPNDDWSAAYSSTLKPTNISWQNRTFTADLTSAFLTSSNTSSLPSASALCRSAEIRPTGTNAGFSFLKRFNSDWRAPNSSEYRTFENHIGGSGRTLEYLGCSNSNNYVWLYWADNALRTVAVRAPWSGQTDRGLKIGDSASRFHELYPEAYRPSGLSFPSDFDVWDSGPLRVVLTGGAVRFIQVDWGSAGDPDNYQSTRTRIGPSDLGYRWH